jgi:hypothetical protein
MYKKRWINDVPEPVILSMEEAASRKPPEAGHLAATSEDWFRCRALLLSGYIYIFIYEKQNT